MSITITRITPAHGPQARSLIARAFSDDPLIKWLFPQESMNQDQRLDAIAIFYWPSVEAYAAAGTGHVALDGDEIVGASLWGLPHSSQPTPVLPSSTTVASILLGSRLKELASEMNAARATGSTPETPYLHDLAVDEGHRNSGIGAELLEAGLNEFDAGGSWLETTNPRNHSFYKRFGFTDVGSHLFADSRVTMTRMVKG